jgi:ATP-dependent RNA helicase DeaD
VKPKEQVAPAAVVEKSEVQKPAPSPDKNPKQSRKTPTDKTRLHMNIGSEMGVTASDVVGAIMGETGLPPQNVGTIDLREKHLFVDVTAEHARSIISKLNRASIKGRKLKVKEA